MQKPLPFLEGVYFCDRGGGMCYHLDQIIALKAVLKKFQFLK